MELSKDKRVFVRVGYTDMRKQINGLAAIVQEIRPDGPFDGSYYVFCGKTDMSDRPVKGNSNTFVPTLRTVSQ